MNKKGFTLIELLTVLVILAMISLVAVPNVVNMVEKNKKKQMVLDAKEMLNKFQNYKTLGKCGDNNPCIFKFKELGLEGKTDGFGDSYTEGSVSYNYSTKEYTITLETDYHCIGKNTNCDSLITKDSEAFDPTVDNIYEVEKTNG